MLQNATARLVIRALVAGVSALVLVLEKNDGSWTQSIWEAAIVAGVLAAVEVFTPVNPNVGVGAKK